MGFTTGFTGGVTLTLGLAYLTVVTHQRNREQQAALLRQQTVLLRSSIEPQPPLLPPTRAEVAAIERANFVESAKDRWNAEIESAVRWAQNKDWDEVQEGVETAFSRLWYRATGGSASPSEVVDAKAQQAAGIVKNEAAGVAAAAKSAYADAKAKSEEKAEAAKDGIFSAIGKGFRSAKEAVMGAEQKVENGLSSSPLPSSTMAPDSVEKALRQRFEKHGGKDVTKTAEEVLAERYRPVEQRDNTKLRAV